MILENKVIILLEVIVYPVDSKEGKKKSNKWNQPCVLLFTEHNVNSNVSSTKDLKIKIKGSPMFLECVVFV